MRLRSRSSRWRRCSISFRRASDSPSRRTEAAAAFPSDSKDRSRGNERRWARPPEKARTQDRPQPAARTAISAAANHRFLESPKGPPIPVDDGASSRLTGRDLPKLVLAATDGREIDLSEIRGRFVLYVYPMTGRPGSPLPDDWDLIPGARGCTPQACAFRDHYKELEALDTGVYGLSAQPPEEQKEARDRLRLPFPLLSDPLLRLKKALRLPTFTSGGLEFYERLTLIVERGRIAKVFHPVFPPEDNAGEVLAWLRDQRGRAAGSPEAS